MKILIVFTFLFLVSTCDPKNDKIHESASEKKQVSEKPPFPVYMTFNEFEHHIRKQTDTTYVVNFWATWCKPCVAELPYFEKLKTAKKDQPVEVLLVSMDFPKQIKSKLIPFVEKRKMEKSVVALADMDYNEWIDKVSTEWDGAIPFTLIYNKEKQQIKLGELDGYEELEGLVAGVMD